MENEIRIHFDEIVTAAKSFLDNISIEETYPKKEHF